MQGSTTSPGDSTGFQRDVLLAVFRTGGSAQCGRDPGEPGPHRQWFMCKSIVATRCRPLRAHEKALCRRRNWWYACASTQLTKTWFGLPVKK